MPLALVILATLFQPAFAKSIPNLVLGNYKLITGTVQQCGTGEFKMREDGKAVLFGVHHGFNIETGASVVDADIPELAGCKYEVRSTVTPRDGVTILVFTQTLLCQPSVMRHTLEKTATVRPNKVEIKLNQAGNPDFGDQEPSYSFLCIWEKKSK